jgi:hypothetical protein
MMNREMLGVIRRKSEGKFNRLRRVSFFPASLPGRDLTTAFLSVTLLAPERTNTGSFLPQRQLAARCRE